MSVSARPRTKPLRASTIAGAINAACGNLPYSCRSAIESHHRTGHARRRGSHSG
jgi:hypothetical protein